jgi:hypothetical protein
VSDTDRRSSTPSSWVWWEEESGLNTLVFVSSGPSPLSHQSWLTRLVAGRPGPGQWAVVNQPPLGPLPEDLVAQMRAASPLEGQDRGRRLMTLDGEEVLAEGGWESDDPLFRRVLEASNTLTMRRARQAGVSQDPAHSGLSLIRLQVRRSLVVLVTAPMRPAASPGGAPARALAWTAGPRFGIRSGDGAPRWCAARADMAAARPVQYGTVEVRLPGAPEAASLPAATFAWDLAIRDGAPACRFDRTGVELSRPGGQPAEVLAELELPLLGCAMPAGLCERWRTGAAAEPVVSISVGASLSDADPFGPAVSTAQGSR